MEYKDTDKMNKEVAIEWLYDLKHYIKYDEQAEALDIAIEDVGRQIPKKPIHDHHCPNCEYGIPIPEFAIDEFKPFAFYPTYCWECGQRIDWGMNK